MNKTNILLNTLSLLILGSSIAPPFSLADYRSAETVDSRTSKLNQVGGDYWKDIPEESLGSRDGDSPLWGIADLHAHLMGHLGHGQTMLAGAPDGDIQKALGSCRCLHAGNLLEILKAPSCSNITRSIVNNTIDTFIGFVFQNATGHPSEGYPNFTAWPHFTTITHQQLWHEWIRRAYNCGLRVKESTHHLRLAQPLSAPLSQSSMTRIRQSRTSLRLW